MGSAAERGAHGVIAYYNVGWQSSRFNKLARHRRSLSDDLFEAVETKYADVILLSERGEIGKGLGERWAALVRSICGPGFRVDHQGHYTSIVRAETVEVLEGPSLKGPPSRFHADRTCQHLRVQWKDSAAEPIDLFNVHAASSENTN